MKQGAFHHLLLDPAGAENWAGCAAAVRVEHPAQARHPASCAATPWLSLLCIKCPSAECRGLEMHRKPCRLCPCLQLCRLAGLAWPAGPETSPDLAPAEVAAEVAEVEVEIDAPVSEVDVIVP